MKPSDAISLEPERYELRAAPIYRFKLPRRTFFKVLGSGVLVVCLVRQAAAQESGRAGRRSGGGGRSRPQEIGAWLHIGEDGTITYFSGKAEVGQNVRTMLTQVVAEELRTPIGSVRSVLGDTELTPYDAGTFGSRSTPDMVPQLRRAAAAAREILLDLVAEQTKADRADFVVTDGRVKNTRTDKTIGFGEITKGRKLMRAVTAEAPQTSSKNWRIAGTSVPKVDGAKFVTGEHQYSSDITRPGMLFGKIVRPASFNAKLLSADTATAEAMPGVKVVRDQQLLGVIAPDVLTAQRAAKSIKADWQASPQISHRELFSHLKKNARPLPTPTLNDGEQHVAATYHIAYIAHAPLEPRSAVAEWTDGKLTVWTGTQRPFGVRSELAGAFGIPEDRVRVIVPDTGSGYGGKHTGEAAVEAARLAKSAGKPVKLVWTREEEFTWAYFRPAGVIDVSARVDRDGKITAWDFHNYNSGSAGLRVLYDVPGARTEFHNASAPLRQGSYRALAATANHFARESHIDDLAHAVKMDPLQFRLKNLTDSRLRAVLQAAAEKFGWAKVKSTSDRGFGIAVGSEKGSCVATCVEIALGGNGKISVTRVVQAFECGAVLNPKHLENQNEGCIMMGIGGALFEEIQFENGRILNGRFADYRVPRFSDTPPQIEIVLLDRKDSASVGAGETPIVGIAPAIGNAIFAATGKRLRALPLVPDGLKA